MKLSAMTGMKKMCHPFWKIYTGLSQTILNLLRKHQQALWYFVILIAFFEICSNCFKK